MEQVENPDFMAKVVGDLLQMDDHKRAIGTAASVITAGAILTRIFPENTGYRRVVQHFTTVLLEDFSVDEFLAIAQTCVSVLKDIDPEALASIDAIGGAEAEKLFEPN